jgi:hypothetical protein
MTTSNLRISYINRADSATLTASPAAGSATPVTYLQNDARGHLFAAEASGSQEIKGEWGGTAYTIGCVRLDRTNLVDGDTLRIELYSNADWTSRSYDSTAAAPFATDLYDAWDYSNAELFFTPVAGVTSFGLQGCFSARTRRWRSTRPRAQRSAGSIRRRRIAIRKAARYPSMSVHSTARCHST